MIGAHKVRIANHIADVQPMFRCEFSVPHADVVRTRDEGLRAGFAMFREVLSLEIKEDCVLECSVPGVGKGTYDIGQLKARRARDERIDLYDGSTLTGRLHVRLAWRFDPGLDYAPFTPEPVRMKAEVANQLKIALVQAWFNGGSPLVVSRCRRRTRSCTAGGRKKKEDAASGLAPAIGCVEIKCRAPHAMATCFRSCVGSMAWRLLKVHSIFLRVT